jgi:hypothetical protein
MNFHPNTPSLATQDMQGFTQKRRRVSFKPLGEQHIAVVIG